MLEPFRTVFVDFAGNAPTISSLKVPLRHEDCPWRLGLKKSDSVSRISFIFAGPRGRPAQPRAVSRCLPAPTRAVCGSGCPARCGRPRVAAAATPGSGAGRRSTISAASTPRARPRLGANSSSDGLSPTVNINLNFSLAARAISLLAPTYTFAQPVFGGQLWWRWPASRQNAASMAGTLTEPLGNT